jgi:hypothetical protein
VAPRDDQRLARLPAVHSSTGAGSLIVRLSRRKTTLLLLRSHYFLQGIAGLGIVAVLQVVLGHRRLSAISLGSEPVRATLLLAAGAVYCTALALTPQLSSGAWRAIRPGRHVVLAVFAAGTTAHVSVLAVVTALALADSRAMVPLLWLGLLGPAILATVVLPPGLAWAPPVGIAMMSALLGPADAGWSAGLLLRWPLGDPAESMVQGVSATLSTTCLVVAIALRLSSVPVGGGPRRLARNRVACRPPGSPESGPNSGH